MKNKTVLFLGIGRDQLPMLKAAIELDLQVIAFDGNPEAIGFKHLDNYEVVNIKDPDEVEKAALKWNKKLGIDGVIAPAVDIGISVGRVVDILGLPGVGEKNAELMTDKLLRCGKMMKERIPQPKWSSIPEDWNIFPCIIKPRNCAGAKGIKYIETKEQLLKEKFDIVQEYLDGWELSTEVLVQPDGSFFEITADRNYDKKLKWKPAVIEDGCQLPSMIPVHIHNKIHNLIRRLIKIFSLTSCVMKLDLIVKDNIVYLIECPPRLGGGRLSSVMIPLVYKIDWWKSALCLAMGIPVEIMGTPSCFAVQRYKFGEVVNSHYDRLGDVIETGQTYQEALQKAENKIRNYVKP
jgi:biotin carboxylase